MFDGIETFVRVAHRSPPTPARTKAAIRTALPKVEVSKLSVPIRFRFLDDKGRPMYP